MLTSIEILRVSFYTILLHTCSKNFLDIFCTSCHAAMDIFKKLLPRSKTKLKEETTANLEFEEKKQKLLAKQAETCRSRFSKQYDKEADREREEIKEQFTSSKVKKLQKGVLALTNREENLKCLKEFALAESKLKLATLEQDHARKYDKKYAEWKSECERNLNNIAALRNANISKYHKNINEVLYQIRKNSFKPKEKAKAEKTKVNIETQHQLDLSQFKKNESVVLDDLRTKIRNLKSDHAEQTQDFKDQVSKNLEQYEKEIETVSEDLDNLKKKLEANEQYREMQAKHLQLDTELNQKKSSLERACLKEELKHQFKGEEIQLVLEDRGSRAQTSKRKCSKVARFMFFGVWGGEFLLCFSSEWALGPFLTGNNWSHDQLGQDSMWCCQNLCRTTKNV